ncbi:hypothetical protein GLUCOINTEAF2_0203791 [Komagataeibacter intermedius AF2]|uniref:Uncharacterized protein n=1 Tax=Komagataeibacter intermedius AF2 TaxID=1458464 RepID=A0A0N1FD73_9PROT|nr:hypothetical protein GLUCOINTEAF2_0203791 [Komagataeibacter intermedius AF2]
MAITKNRDLVLETGQGAINIFIGICSKSGLQMVRHPEVIDDDATSFAKACSIHTCYGL